MKDIKASPKNIKGLSPAGQRIKNALIQTKAKADQQVREQEAQQKAAPVEYAENALSAKTQTGAKKAAHLLNQRGKKAVKNLPKDIRSVKQKTRSAIKTAQKSIKTAKTAGQTVKTTAKTTAKTAQAAVKSTKAAAKAAATTAKATGKAIASAGKAIAAAIKALVEIIIAGGWIAVVVILVIVLIAAVVMVFVGENGKMPDISSISSFSSSYFEQVAS